MGETNGRDSLGVVVLVDDEVDALKAFEEAFGATFNVATFSSAETALEALRTTRDSVAVVIADQRMPGMKGVDFLSKIKVLIPDALRFLVTAYSEVDVLQAAINSGAAHRYIQKPWQPEVLESQITQAVLNGGASNVPDALALRDAQSSLKAIRLAASGVLHTGLDELGIHGVIGTQLFILLSESMDKGREESVERKLGKLLDLALGSLELVRISWDQEELLTSDILVETLKGALSDACSLADRTVNAKICGLETLDKLVIALPRIEFRQLISLYCLAKFCEFSSKNGFEFAVKCDEPGVGFSLVTEDPNSLGVIDDRVLEISFGLRLLANRLRIECLDVGAGPVTSLLAVPGTAHDPEQTD